MGSAFLVCIRSRCAAESRSSVWTTWDSPAELLKADRELDARGCGDRRCERAHILAWCDHSGRIHVRSGSHDPVGPLPLEQLYPRQQHHEFPPERWPVDPELNEPFERPRDGSVLAERFASGQRVALMQALAEAVAPVPDYPLHWPPTVPAPGRNHTRRGGGTRQAAHLQHRGLCGAARGEEFVSETLRCAALPWPVGPDSEADDGGALLVVCHQRERLLVVERCHRSPRPRPVLVRQQEVLGASVRLRGRHRADPHRAGTPPRLHGRQLRQPRPLAAGDAPTEPPTRLPRRMT